MIHIERQRKRIITPIDSIIARDSGSISYNIHPITNLITPSLVRAVERKNADAESYLITPITQLIPTNLPKRWVSRQKSQDESIFITPLHTPIIKSKGVGGEIVIYTGRLIELSIIKP